MRSEKRTKNQHPEQGPPQYHIQKGREERDRNKQVVVVSDREGRSKVRELCGQPSPGGGWDVNLERFGKGECFR